jgi:hypothetical protein
MDILVTNNPLVEARYGDRLQVEYLQAHLIDVLIRVRDHVHKGRCLLTHPLSGSVKPNETPYKSILVSEERGITDEQSVRIIEECLSTVRGFPSKHIPEYYLSDLRTVDLSLITTALELRMDKMYN